MFRMGYVIAIDVGGTHLRAAAYAPESQIPLKHQRTKSHAPNEKIFDRMAALGRYMLTILVELANAGGKIEVNPDFK